MKALGLAVALVCTLGSAAAGHAVPLPANGTYVDSVTFADGTTVVLAMKVTRDKGKPTCSYKGKLGTPSYQYPIGGQYRGRSKVLSGEVKLKWDFARPQMNGSFDPNTKEFTVNIALPAAIVALLPYPLNQINNVTFHPRKGGKSAIDISGPWSPDASQGTPAWQDFTIALVAGATYRATFREAAGQASMTGSMEGVLQGTVWSGQIQTQSASGTASGEFRLVYYAGNAATPDRLEGGMSVVNSLGVPLDYQLVFARSHR